MPNGIKIITGNANKPLAEKVSNHLQISLVDATVSVFNDGEVVLSINENVRGFDVFVIQPTCAPVNDNLMELLLMIDALKRASARRITAVIPYYGYARQDRKTKPRVPISSKLVADLLTVAGSHRILTIDLHAGQIQGFFNIPVDHLYAEPVLYNYFKGYQLQDLVIVSPDAGGVERARAFSKRLNATLAIIDKRRDTDNISKVMHVIGEVKDKDAIILDDMIDTAGSTINAAQALKENGAKRIFAACTHAVLSENAIDLITNSELEKVITTDTIPLEHKASLCQKLEILTISDLLSEAIRRIYEESSISSLFI